MNDDQDQGVAWPSLRPPMGALGQNHKTNSILKISKVLFYSSKSHDFYGIVVGKPWIWKRKFNHSVLIASLKSLVLTQIGLRLSQEPQRRCQSQHASLKAYLKHDEHLRWSFFVKIIKGFS